MSGLPRPRAGLCVAVALIGAGALCACGAEGPNASPDEIARAEEVYTACVEDVVGIEVENVDIRPNGDIDVDFGEGYTREGEALAISICEPRIGGVLEPGGRTILEPPANLGRPASDRELAQLLAERASLGFEGAIIAESDGVRRLEAGFGDLAAGSMRIPDTDTAFDCGSIMKEVTAALIFLLEQDGLLSRQQALAEFFEAVPSVWRDVTLAQLLEHSAGFDEYHDTEGDFEPLERAAALDAIFAQQPRFAPGTDSAYSSSGYTLLAAIIEEVTGDEYRSLARERVFEPLGMQRSGFYGDPLWSDGNVAVGRGAAVYAGNDPSRWPPPTWALLGNGGLVSSLEDLLRLAKAFDDDSLFRPDTREAFRANQPGGYIAGKSVIGYAGGNDFGFNAVVAQVPEDASYVVAASHVLAPINGEILGIEVLQTLYGAVIEPSADE